MILSNFQKKFEWGVLYCLRVIFFQFLAVSGHSESILMFPISCKIDPVGGGIEGDKKSLFAILPYFANRIFDLITHTYVDYADMTKPIPGGWGDQKSSFAISPYFANCIFDPITCMR